MKWFALWLLFLFRICDRRSQEQNEEEWTTEWKEKMWRRWWWRREQAKRNIENYARWERIDRVCASTKARERARAHTLFIRSRQRAQITIDWNVLRFVNIYSLFCALFVNYPTAFLISSNIRSNTCNSVSNINLYFINSLDSFFFLLQIFVSLFSCDNNAIIQSEWFQHKSFTQWRTHRERRTIAGRILFNDYVASNIFSFNHEILLFLFHRNRKRSFECDSPFHSRRLSKMTPGGWLMNRWAVSTIEVFNRPFD